MASKCHFLKLSPELLNTIYRLVLVSDNAIEVKVTDAPPMDPPLLRTCRQIRREARGIYYQENTVNFTVLDYDIRKIVAWLDLSSAHHDLYSNAQLTLSISSHSTVCWYHLHYWIFMYRMGRITRLTRASSSVATGSDGIQHNEGDRSLAIGLFDLAESHLAAGSDSQTIHAALEQYRKNVMRPHPVHHRIWHNLPDPPFPPRRSPTGRFLPLPMFGLLIPVD
jgi:hypothetical protein